MKKALVFLAATLLSLQAQAAFECNVYTTNVHVCADGGGARHSLPTYSKTTAPTYIGDVTH